MQQHCGEFYQYLQNKCTVATAFDDDFIKFIDYYRYVEILIIISLSIYFMILEDNSNFFKFTVAASRVIHNIAVRNCKYHQNGGSCKIKIDSI